LNVTAIFFLGLIIALVGVIPPGLLNMTAAKVSLKEGPNRGIIFSVGVCLIVFLQTYIAAMLARYLNNHQDAVEILQRVAFVIFVLITVYFLLLASAINLLPIPYQAYMTITIAGFGWFNFEKTSILTYVTGAAMGTFVMLYVYIFFFDKVKNKKLTTQKNMNYIIGTITGIVAGITLINILMD